MQRYAAWCLLLSLAHPAAAQSSRGTVNGLVTDPAGASIPGARVEIKGVQTGAVRSTTTNESGAYRFDAVDLDDYVVSVTAGGFQVYQTQPVSVVANQTRTIDCRLAVGEQKTVVQVEATAATLQVEAPVRGANIDNRDVSELPFAARNPVSLALNTPGVSTNRTTIGVSTFVVNGARGRSNNFLIDGTENNDISVAGQGLQITNPDAIQEVAVQTSNYDSEFGRAGGAVVNVVTKSGTNAFHGTASLLLDVTNDDAITYLQSLDPEVQARGRQLPGTDQWWAGTIGGPIRKNRTFFFQSFQQERQRSSSSIDVTAPSAAGRAALNSLFPKGTNPRVDLFNQITAGTDAASDLFPVALGAGRPAIEFGTAIFGFPQTFTDTLSTTRIDHTFNERNLLSGRFLYDNQSNPAAAVNWPGFITTQQNRYMNAMVAYTRVFSPSLTNELRLPYNRISLSFPNDPANPLGATMPLYTFAASSTRASESTSAATSAFKPICPRAASPITTACRIPSVGYGAPTPSVSAPICCSSAPGSSLPSRNAVISATRPEAGSPASPTTSTTSAAPPARPGATSATPPTTPTSSARPTSSRTAGARPAISLSPSASATNTSACR